MSSFKSILTVVFLLSFVCMLSYGVHADSMLSNSSIEKIENSLNIPLDSSLNGNLSLPAEKIGIENSPADKSVKKVNKISPKKITKEKTYPPIYIRYRNYSSRPCVSSKTYKHYSSRSGYRSEYLNITPIIISEAKKNRISPLLLKGVISVESGFNCYAVGGGALGLCQLMPSTARSLGVRDPFNPYQNIAGGARYLGGLSRRYNGDINRVLAAYNMGPGCVGSGIPSCAWGFISAVKSRMKW